jgi:acyl-CoA thioester hydrolase
MVLLCKSLRACGGDEAVPKIEMPSLARVRELPELVRHVVPPEWEDMNGHVNVQHYTALYDMSSDPFMGMMGITAEHVRDTRVGIFDLEHHVWFLEEMRVGDMVTGHACIVERGPKRMLAVMFIVDETRERLASVLEVVSTTSDLDARRTIAIPPPLATRLDKLIEEQRARGWPPPRSGALSV